MAGLYNLPYGGSHPGLNAQPLAKMESNTPQGQRVKDFFSHLTERIHEIMSQQFLPKSDQTLDSLIMNVNKFLGQIVNYNLKNYDGWAAFLFPLRETRSSEVEIRIWNKIPQALTENPEGVAPQIQMHQYEDHKFALRRFNAGAKQKHMALETAEGLENWLLDLNYFQSMTNLTFNTAAIEAIDNLQSSFGRQALAQGYRLFGNVADALTLETELYLVGLTPNWPYKLFNMANQRLVTSSNQLPYNALVLPSGMAQRIAYSSSELNLQQRGSQALVNLIEGGKGWTTGALPGVTIFELEKLDYVEMGGAHEALERISTISSFFVIDGRTGLRDKRNYVPQLELTVKVRDTKTSPALNTYGYERALQDCHRFTPEGYLDATMHGEMLARIKSLMEQGSFEIGTQADLDPFVWHAPGPVDPSSPQFHVCVLYGDVSKAFRSFQVDEVHGEAFAREARKYIGEEDISKLAALRELVNRLDKPPADTWTADIMGAWVTAVIAGDPDSLGVYPVPDMTDELVLPYGFTTIAGVHALAQAHELKPGKWGDEGKAAFKIAHDAWPVLKRLWSFVRRAYPKCVLVETDQFVPSWMRSTDKDLNAFYATMANFYDDRVRYPAWMGDAGDPSFMPAAGDLGITDEQLAHMTEVDATILMEIKDDPIKFKSTYETRIASAYQRLIAKEHPAVGTTFREFLDVELNGLTAEQSKNLMTGIVTLVYEWMKKSATDPGSTLTRKRIVAWKERPRRTSRETSPTSGGGYTNTRLSFHRSVWQYAAQVAKLRPANPLFSSQHGLDDGQFPFARSHLTQGTRFAPLQTRSSSGPPPPPEQEDLGSYDPLDDKQMLYPNLVSPESDIMWKVDEEGKYVETYYLRARVEHVRKIEPDMFAKLGTLCLLFSRICIQTNKACIRVNIPPPDLCFMCVHFAIRQQTQGVIFGRGGGLAGTMLWGFMDNLIGVDPIAKEWTSHYEVHIGCVVTDPRYILHHRDVFTKGSMTGYDTSSVPQDFTTDMVNLDKAMIVMYCGSEFTRERARSEANPFPLSGRFDPNYFGNVNFSDDFETLMTNPNVPPFPGFWFYAHLHQLQGLHRVQQWSYESVHAENQTRYLPGIVFMEEHVSLSQGLSGPVETRHQGTGHTKYWPDDIKGLTESTHVFHSVPLRD